MASIGYVRVSHIVEESADGGFVSRCPELGIASQGESVGEALNNLRDATYTYLNTIEQLGDREQVFQEKGIKVYATKPRDAVHFEMEPPQQAASVFIAQVRGEPRPDRQLSSVG